MLIQILKILINSLFFTILIELVFALLLKVRNKKDIINIVLVNIVTNPIVVLFPYIVGLRYGIILMYIVLILFEIFALVFEGYVYKRELQYSRINPYILSLILNLASYIIGVYINSIIY